MKPLIYLASPYTHKSKKIRDERAKLVSRLAGRLINKGYNVYCPIAETVMLAKYGGLSNTNWTFWREKDLNQLSRCDEIWLTVDIDGWKDSVGLKGEVKFAIENKIKIALIGDKLKPKYCNWRDIVYGIFKLKSLTELEDF